MRRGHKLSMLALAVSATVVAACSTADNTVTSPELASVSFNKRQTNRCDKYTLIDGPFTPDGARTNAKLLGGVVASISSLEEQTCVQALRGDYDYYWLNASDAASEGEWRWLNARKNGLFWIGGVEGKSYGYSNWGDGEPGGEGGENCAAIVDDYGVWVDLGCTSTNGYVLKSP